MIYNFDYSPKPPVKEGHLNIGGVNPDGIEINANSRYITRGAKPFIPIMGEFHFSRADKNDWETEIIKMKNGGITLISTYMFWIYHEETEGEFDFSDDNDIRTFVELCKKHNIDVVLRIGPWAHGECRNGGFPDWLLNKGFKLRTDDEKYLEYVKIWYKSIYEEVKGLFYKDGGNIIAIQIENELVDQSQHLHTLKNIAKEIGLIAPLYTVTGWNSKYGAKIPKYEFIPVFGGYPEAPWTGHTKQLEPNPHYFLHPMRNDSAIGEDLLSGDIDNDEKAKAEGIEYDLYPYATCELGGGIQVTTHRRPKISGMDIYAISLCRLGSGNNLPGYYMYHGGTNKIGKLSTFHESTKTGYPNDVPVKSYDFQAAIGEFGILRPQYYMLRLLHMFINDFMETLAPMDAYFSPVIPERKNTTDLRYSVRTDGNSGFVFFNNYSRLETLSNHNEVQFEVNKNNESFVFPKEPVEIKDGVNGIMPFNMKIGNAVLDYATCQLFKKENDTYYFFEIPNVRAEYSINGNVIMADFSKPVEIDGVKLVTMKYDEALYFNIEKQNLDIADAVIEETAVTITPYMLDKLEVPHKTYKQYKISASKESEFIRLSYDGDKAMLFNGETLMADDFYYGDAWIFPSKLLNDSSVLLILDKSCDVYMEV